MAVHHTTMGEVDKPFGCPQPGCGMRFTNEDHLTVHRRCHEMQLSVPGDHHTPSLVKHHGFIIDQTPTPTRFLRQCEEVGLFQEISLNPFDEQFRRASLLRSHHSITESVSGGGGAGESLDTPRVLPPVDSDQTITSTTSRDDLVGAAGGVTVPTSQHHHHHHHHQTQHHQHPSTPTRYHDNRGDSEDGEGLYNEYTEDEGDKVVVGGGGGRLSLNVESAAAEAGLQTSSVISTPTPVITAGPSVSQSLGLVECTTIGGLRLSSGGSIPPYSPAPPQLPASSATLCSASSRTGSVPPSPSATVLQLLLRLPNGQAIPVEIPATPVVSSPASSYAPTSFPSTSASPPLSMGDGRILPQQSLAKMRLKQALASSSTAARPGGGVRASRANTADRIAEMTMTRTRHFSGTSSTEGEGEDDGSMESSGGMKSGERKRRHSSDNDDPVEKRKKFLERNRAAAIRCREKKKKWIENLSVKYDELGCINQKLQTEVGSLRSEVAALKTMLLQHKDCPVTLAMQGDGCCDGGYVPVPYSLPPIPIPVLPRPSVPSPATSPGSKPRTRSLSLPSIPSSTPTSRMEPLPVNLSCSSSYSSPSSTYSNSSSSCIGLLISPPTKSAHSTSVSSSTKLPSTHLPPGHTITTTTTSYQPRPGSIIMAAPLPPSSSLHHHHHHHHPTILSTSNPSPLSKVTVVGTPDTLAATKDHQVPQTLVLAPNVIMTTPQQHQQPSLLNLTAIAPRKSHH